MTIDLTRDEIWCLKALRAAGQRGRTVSAPASHAGLARLVEMQYVTQHSQSERNTLYIITDRGRQALANSTQNKQHVCLWRKADIGRLLVWPATTPCIENLGEMLEFPRLGPSQPG